MGRMAKDVKERERWEQNQWSFVEKSWPLALGLRTCLRWPHRYSAVTDRFLQIQAQAHFRIKTKITDPSPIFRFLLSTKLLPESYSI